ncbi:MAG: hypothetical protein H6922_03785 [Pseudomonadaceae bacterium]|nr:hypothetical protein [Pseudomonadaceae bacterium]
MKHLVLAAAAAATLAACSTTPQYETCPYAGINLADGECRAIENIHNIKAGAPAVAAPTMHMIHGMVHYAGCPNGGTKAHTHNGVTFHRACY